MGRRPAGRQDRPTSRCSTCSTTRSSRVDYNRDQGFLTGMGIDTKDKQKNGDEDKTGTYTGGKGGELQIVCNEPTKGAQDKGKTAMETCLAKTKDINLVYTINEPAAVGASEALKAAGITDATIVSVDGGCSPGLEAVKSGVISAHLAAVPGQDGPARRRGDREDRRRRREAGRHAGPRLLRHRRRPGDRQAGRRRREHRRRRRPKRSAGASEPCGRPRRRRRRPRGAGQAAPPSDPPVPTGKEAHPRASTPKPQRPRPSSSRCGASPRCNASSTCCTRTPRSARSWC